jgi:hypothetical protein
MGVSNGLGGVGICAIIITISTTARKLTKTTELTIVFFIFSFLLNRKHWYNTIKIENQDWKKKCKKGLTKKEYFLFTQRKSINEPSPTLKKQVFDVGF